MRENEDVPPAGRSVRESEIFREPPGSGNYTSSIGAAVGIELFQGRDLAQRARSSKTIVEPEREVPVLAETDVLVVGGGPAGTAAAIAAARLGADVLLIERYNHLGGLSTGGLVIWIDRDRPIGPADISSAVLPRNWLIGCRKTQSPGRPAPTGAAETQPPLPIGRSGPRPTTASSHGRRPSIPSC